MYDNWEELEKSIIGCRKCKLCDCRNNIVFGEGNKNANIMFIGEIPGIEEDKSGKPFVSKSGQLMANVLDALEISKERIYITYILKCMSINNVEFNEIKTCINYLRNQVILVKPKIIVLLGKLAVKSILGEDVDINNVRGKFIERKNILYLSTWNPIDFTRDETKKIEFWKDLKNIKEKIKELELEI